MSLDHITPAEHKGPVVNGYLLQRRDDRSWAIYDSQGNFTLHVFKSLGEAVAVARCNQPQ